jgi:multiple sugar transport system permease protein
MKRSAWFDWAMLAPAQSLLIGVIALPALYVFWLSLTQSSYGQAPVWVGWDNYRTVLADPYFWRAFVNTFVVVNVVVYFDLTIALSIALLFASGVPARRLMITIVLAPYAISEVVAVTIWRYLMDPEIGPLTHLLTALGLPPLDWSVSGAAGLVLVGLINLWMHLPFTFVLLYTGLLAIPANLYEAARIDGATAWNEFWRITLPLLTPVILVTVLFRTIFGLRLFSEVWLLTHGGPVRSSEVLALYLYVTGFRYGDFGGAAATGWLMLLASLAISLIYMHRMYRTMFAYA